jgi:hypothetical protein
MKKLLLTTALLASSAMAGGKISIQPQYHLQSKKMGVTSGISAYKHLAGPVSLNSWAGIGYRPSSFNEGSIWTSAFLDVDLQLGKIVVSPGIQYRIAKEFGNTWEQDPSVNVKLSYIIW